MLKFIRKQRTPLAGIVLVLLSFGAYVPVGFMPASGTPFRVELCPAASPQMPMPAHHHHPGGSPAHSHFDHCPFGSAPAAGPPSHVIAFSAVQHALPLRLGVDAPQVRSMPLRAHQARGPPALA